MPDFIIFGVDQNYKKDEELLAQLRAVLLKIPDTPETKNVPCMIDIKQFEKPDQKLHIIFYCGIDATPKKIESTRSLLSESISPYVHQIFPDREILLHYFRTPPQNVSRH